MLNFKSKKHSIDAKKSKKRVLNFREHKPNLNEKFSGPPKVEKKPNEKTRKKRRSPEVFINEIQSDKKQKKNRQSLVTPEIPSKLFFRPQVLGLAEMSREL